MNNGVVLVKEMIFQKMMKFSTCFPSKYLVSGAFILNIIFIADYQAHAPLLQMFFLKYISNMYDTRIKL